MNKISIEEINLLAMQQEAIAIALEHALAIGIPRNDTGLSETDYIDALCSINLTQSKEVLESIRRFVDQEIQERDK